MQQAQPQTDLSAQLTRESTMEDFSSGLLAHDDVRVSDLNLGGIYDWLSGLFSGEEEQGMDAVIGQVLMQTGTASVLRNDQKQTLSQGDSIFEDDTISTGADSALTISFKDGMELRLGEEAKFLIDDFVFDQSSSTGLQTLAALRGAFSYQSGELAANDPSAVTIKTPQGTLGIRGTKVMGLADTPVGQCIITLLEGRVEVSGDRGGSVVLSEKFETAKMRIEWDYVDKSQFSREKIEETFKDLLFGGDEEAMESFIGAGKSSFIEQDSLFSIYGEVGQEQLLGQPFLPLTLTEG